MSPRREHFKTVHALKTWMERIRMEVNEPVRFIYYWVGEDLEPLDGTPQYPPGGYFNVMQAFLGDVPKRSQCSRPYMLVRVDDGRWCAILDQGTTTPAPEAFVQGTFAPEEEEPDAEALACEDPVTLGTDDPVVEYPESDKTEPVEIAEPDTPEEPCGCPKSVHFYGKLGRSRKALYALACTKNMKVVPVDGEPDILVLRDKDKVPQRFQGSSAEIVTLDEFESMQKHGS